MFLFYRLLLAHLLADFPFQIPQLFRLKVISRWGTVFHGAIFILLALFLAFPYLHHNAAWVLILLLGISHILIDEAKLFITRKFKIDNLWLFLLDQGLHIGLIGLLAATSLGRLILSWPFSDEVSSFLTQVYNDPQSKVIIYIIAYIIATFGGTFLIYYLKKTFFSKQLGEVIISRPEKYCGMVERLLILSLFIFPGYFFVLTPVVLGARRFAYVKHKDPHFRVDFFVSTALAIIIGLTLRAWIVLKT